MFSLIKFRKIRFERFLLPALLLPLLALSVTFSSKPVYPDIVLHRIISAAFIICSMYAPSIGKLLNDKMDKSIKRYFKDPYMFYKVVPIKNVEFGPTYHRVLYGTSWLASNEK